ncbi:unnamed protein product [Urochloa decumbens]|uniref:Uncharacterized protein n=1 Tax=Urochloa decumbens TaxID=240449 RepID=A0ABC9DRK2_9POAL
MHISIIPQDCRCPRHRESNKSLVLEHVRNVHRVPVDGRCPGPLRVGRGLDALPRRAVALEPGPEPNHPHPVALPHPPLGLDVRQLVPERAAGRVPEPVQRHPGRLHLLVGKPQAALQLVDHRPAAGVDAEVLERRAEVGDVWPEPAAEHLSHDEGEREQQLLRRRQHQRADGRDVGLERVPGDGHEVLAQVDPDVPLLVLLLEHARVRAVLRAGERAHDVPEPEPGLVGGVGQQRRRAADAEEAVGQEHGALAAHVVVWRDGLRGHHQRARAFGSHLEEVPGEPHGDEPRAAAHPGEVHVPDVRAHPVPVDDHVDERRGRAEEAAVDDDDVDVAGVDPRLAEEVVDGSEHDHVHLPARRVEGAVLVGRDVVVGGGKARLLPEARPLEELGHEPDAALVEGRHLLGVLEEGGEGDPAVGPRAEAGVVDQVHRAGTEQEVHGRRRGREERGQEQVRGTRVADPAGELLGPEARRGEQGGGRERHRHDGEEEVVHDAAVHGLEALLAAAERRWRRAHAGRFGVG